MKNNKRFITACLCLAAAIAICCVTGANFLKARELPMPVEGPGVTERRASVGSQYSFSDSSQSILPYLWIKNAAAR